jgi:hypothetical protein
MTHDDDKFEAFLEREARAYNAPPSEVPRDMMWERIAEARAARPVAAPVAAPAVIAIAPHRPLLRYAPWIGMAATLLLGVGIGRYAYQGTPAGSSDTARVAAAPASSPTDPITAIPVTSSEPTQAPRGSAVQFAPAARAAQVAQRARQELPAVAVATPRRAPNSGPYSVASQQHLTRAEALVAVVAAMPRDAMMDSLTARWAKDVLTNTRLLLDSPAGDDPVRRRLLEDLETVLVQLVQRSGRAAEDRDMLDRTLEKTQLLTRLRSGATGT